MSKKLIFHPLIFATFPVLFLFGYNVNYLRVNEVLVPLGILFAIAATIIAPTLLLRDNRKAALLISLLFIFFFSFGHFKSLVFGISKTRSEFLLLYIWEAIFIILGIIIIKLKRIDKLHSFFVTVSIVLLSMAVLKIGYEFFRISHSRQAHGFLDDTAPIQAGADSSQKRDIYYIILDRYASNATLKREFHYENSAFLDSLRTRGFYVALQSKSNYLKTALSLASSLNLSYINTMTGKVGEDCDDWQPAYGLLQDYRAWRFLRSKGYRFYHFGAWWEGTSQNDFADMNFNIRPLREFTMLLLKLTVIYPYRERSTGLKKYMDFNDWELHHWRILYQFKTLAQMPYDPRPKFVFAHLLVPHEPFVFDSTGRYVTWEETEKLTYEQNYVNQLKFTNKQALSLVDSLQQRSRIKPVILIQADEGPYPLPYRLDEKHFQWHSATRAQFKRKMAILNSYYLPEADTSGLYQSISPVNSLRMVFNLYFHTNLPLLQDRSYAFKDDLHPYTFFDVTDSLK
jgi:hypothetical protein